MSPSPIPGFITKTEVAETYGRSHRSLTRDFSRAVRVGDADVLSHLRLHTEDGEVREGPDVTLELIQELSNKGLTPTWYIEQQWAARTYPKEAKTSIEKPATPTPSPVEAEQSTGPPKQTSETARLEQQIKDLKRDKEELREELTIKNEQIRDGHQRQKETNELIRELHHLMAHMQERLLPAPASPREQTSLTPPHVPAEATPPAQATEAVSVDGDTSRTSVETTTPTNPTTGDASSKRPKHTRSKPRKSRSNSKPLSRSTKKQPSSRTESRSTTRKKEGTLKPQSRSKTKKTKAATKPPKSKTQPTFRERVSSFFRRPS